MPKNANSQGGHPGAKGAVPLFVVGRFGIGGSNSVHFDGFEALGLALELLFQEIEFASLLRDHVIQPFGQEFQMSNGGFQAGKPFGCFIFH